jgi:FkbM family methyltransferase
LLSVTQRWFRIFRFVPRPLKAVGKKILRALVHRRLDWWPLSLPQAEHWAERIKRWPALFDRLQYSRRRNLPGNIVMELGLVDVIERHLLVTDEWEPVIRSVLKAYLAPGDFFVDVGANIGYFALVASRIVGNRGRVVAFEPSLRALKKLTHNLQLNQVTNVSVISVAIGDMAATATLQLAHESNIGGSNISASPDDGGPQEVVAVARLDDIVSQFHQPPKLIKIDVEGYELYALCGAKDLVTRFHPTIVCEIGQQHLAKHGTGAADVLRFMESLGYSAFILGRSDEGNVVCRACASQDEWCVSHPVDVLFTTGELPFSFSRTESGSRTRTAAIATSAQGMADRVEA